MSQSRTRDVGLDVSKVSIAVAHVATEHGIEVVYIGMIGTRHGDIDRLIRDMPSKAKQPIMVYEAGPCGSWRYRYVRQKGDDCWVVAPSRVPKKAGDRVKTDPRDAVQLPRLTPPGVLTSSTSHLWRTKLSAT